MCRHDLLEMRICSDSSPETPSDALQILRDDRITLFGHLSHGMGLANRHITHITLCTMHRAAVLA